MMENDEKLLAALALAMVRQPKANLNDLAKAVGISKATLYRNFRTRSELMLRLLQHSLDALHQSARDSELESAPPLEALRLLIKNNLAHGELVLFLVSYGKEAGLDSTIVADCERTFDAFFLRGQRAGVFRIDVSAALLTETLLAILDGMIHAAYNGRIARSGLASVIESMFLNGASPERNQ